MTAAACPRGEAARAARAVFIKGDDQQSVAAGLQVGALDQRVDVGLQPRVRRREPAVVRVITPVGCDPRKIGQGVIPEVGLELGEVGKVGLGDVRHILQRVVANVVGPGLFRVVLPGLARELELVGDVVLHDGETRRRLTVVVGQDLSGGPREVIADRGMCVGIVIGRQTVLGDE